MVNVLYTTRMSAAYRNKPVLLDTDAITVIITVTITITVTVKVTVTVPITDVSDTNASNDARLTEVG